MHSTQTVQMGGGGTAAQAGVAAVLLVHCLSRGCSQLPVRPDSTGLPAGCQSHGAVFCRCCVCVHCALQAHDALQYRCPALKKAQGVLDLLQCRLADIVGAWERGVLTADGFTLQEVEGLVMALFEDTDYRAECLQRIEAAAEVAS